ncbi:MAG: hypothetical protein E7671_06000 [Ruminococcaceae bacterium]|nr:hypothetical protein [Oscillospiraceae bacterium]
MGFGLLFFGYALSHLMTLNSFGFVFRLTGCAVMIAGLSKLEAYEKRFFYARLNAIFLAIIALLESVGQLLLGHFPAGSVIATVVSKNIFYVAFLAVTVIFHVFLYRAIRKIARDVGIRNIEERALRYGIFACFELLLLAVCGICWYLKFDFTRYILMAVVLLPYIIIVLNLTLFYSCYKNICEEGDEEAPRKPSRIPFLNKLFEVSEKREQEIYEKTKLYAEDKIRQDNVKKKNKKKKKK